MWEAVVAAVLAIVGAALAASATWLGGAPSPGEESHYLGTFLYAGLWFGLPFWALSIWMAGRCAPALRPIAQTVLASLALVLCALRFGFLYPPAAWPLSTAASLALGSLGLLVWRFGLWHDKMEREETHA